MAKPKVNILVAVPGVTEYEFLPGSVGAYAVMTPFVDDERNKPRLWQSMPIPQTRGK